uniref:DPBB_1 domain-containing protein n=1 Tax=Steinernema glaseri TaxID=37863 RepID=A0A1I7YX64_9BILA
MYAMAVHQLSDQLVQARGASRPTPQGGSNVVRAKPGLDINRAHKDGAPWWDVDVSKIPDATPTVHTGNYKANPYTVLGKTYFPIQDSRNYRAEGTASWYGTKFHGQNTANGEVYDLYGMSAAHKTLPLPAYVKVTNLDNQRSVILRVNDRGPFYSDRIIDLSYAAAKKLGYAETGTARVGAFANPDAAELLRSKLSGMSGRAAMYNGRFARQAQRLEYVLPARA